MATEYHLVHKDIVDRCKAGDRKAQYELYSLYSKAMYNICLRMTNREEEAQDLLQEAFVYAFKRLDSFRNESTFGAWLKRIVVNHCINHLKKRRVELDFDQDFDRMDVPEASYDSSTYEYDIEQVKRAVARLPEGYRVIFSLYLLEGYDHSEIAEILSITESTSKSQFHRAKKKVQETLKSYRYEAG